MDFHLKCSSCFRRYDARRILFHCDACGGWLHGRRERGRGAMEQLKAPVGRGIWNYSHWLPDVSSENRVSLGEGGTPLVRAERLGRELGMKNLFFKCEQSNPTASFKDRGMSCAVSVARELGVTRIFCASTGNTAASLSAYAARAGLRAVLVLPENVPLGKLGQSWLHGPELLRVRGNFDAAMALVREIGARGHYLINSINPYRIEGQKSLAYEILRELDDVPDHILVPAGSGGNLVSLHKAFSELVEAGAVIRMPRLGAVQSENVAPIVAAVATGKPCAEVGRFLPTSAGGIAIGNPVHGDAAAEAVRATSGLAVTVGEEEITRAQRELGGREGIDAEPTASVPFAGLKKLISSGTIGKNETVVCVVTGHALKDPAAAAMRHDAENDRYVADADEALSLLDDGA